MTLLTAPFLSGSSFRSLARGNTQASNARRNRAAAEHSKYDKKLASAAPVDAFVRRGIHYRAPLLLCWRWQNISSFLEFTAKKDFVELVSWNHTSNAQVGIHNRNGVCLYNLHRNHIIKAA